RFKRESFAVEIDAQPGRFARAIVSYGDVLPFIFRDGSGRRHPDAVAGPDAKESGGENSIAKHKVEAVVADIGAEGVLKHDDWLGVASVVADPEVDCERVPAVDMEHFGEGGAVVAVEANGLAVDAGDALQIWRRGDVFCVGRLVWHFVERAIERKITGEVGI